MERTPYHQNVEGTISSSLQRVIQLGDRLRDCGIEKVISLPKIVVIGEQSAGKSSLLESIVGLDFLPRGEDVVTRTPLEIRMVNLATVRSFATFSDSPTKEYTDFEKVKQQITERTIALAGEKNIVDSPIILNFYSKDVPNLTLVDLPGITKIPLDGQDENIQKITEDMSLKYIQEDRTIILCVIPANQDATNSDGLKLARAKDPKGLRTCAVLTKVDIMNKGTDALKILENKYLPLKHGYIAVKLRSQEDINKKMSVRDARETEKDFFKKDPIYKNQTDRCGTANLSKKLSDLLYDQIRYTLPQIKKEIEDKIEEQKGIIKELGDSIPPEPSQKSAYLRTKLRDLNNLIKAYFEGKERFKIRSKPNQKPQPLGETYIMLEAYQHKSKLKETLHAELEKLTDDNIRDEITANARSLPGFYNFEAFTNIVIKHIDSLRKVTETYINQCYKHVEKLLESAISKISGKIPQLKDKITKDSTDFIKERYDKLMKHFEYIIEYEKGYIFSCKKVFKQGGKKPGEESIINSNRQFEEEESINDQEESKIDNTEEFFVSNTEVDNFRSKMKLYLKNYMNVVADTIPKCIMRSLVSEIKKEMCEIYLSSKIIDDANNSIMLKEDENKVRMREDAEDKLDLLNIALEILNNETGGIIFDDAD